ncbi:hypothetical protein [uncultured Tateyamaria sp.]|uniref:DUF1330 domain-containing protein n=1 Tax=uncultured Tateyamaria sp. TaxID=455651 RepID=UPI002602935B|nr:hypothetical protein [uncultured Tateyamaria sp.]
MAMTNTAHSVQNRIESILANWGTGSSGLPDEAAWSALAQCAQDQPVTLVNFFKMRDNASYPTGTATVEDDISGQEAFQRYAGVSIPSVEQAGGKFLMVAPFARTFIGSAEDWDLVAIGSYPNPGAFLSLFEMDAYREAYIHRVAACRAQRVSLCLG